jgi:RNA polymerase sigma-70 factor (ECF subfamily)
MRRKPSQSPARTVSLDELMPDDAELGRLLQDAEESPEGALLHAEQHQILHQAVLQIPPALRMVLVLHDMEDLTTEQVAQILDLKPGTVRVRLHRARLAVRKQMSHVLDSAPPESEAASSEKSASKRPDACRELFANLSEYLDGRVEPRTCDEMRAHIEGCPYCVAFLRDLRAAIDRCRSLEVPCDPAIAQRLRSILTREYLRLLGLSLTEHSSAQM